MQRRMKLPLIHFLSVTAVFLFSYLLNLSLGILVLLVVTATFINVMIFSKPSKDPGMPDQYLKEALDSISVVPAAIERLEAGVSSTADFIGDKISKAWSHHIAEVESINGELRLLSGGKVF